MQEQNQKIGLYNLNEDPTERQNLSGSYPEQLARMRAVLYDMDKQMVDPSGRHWLKPYYRCLHQR